MSTTVDLPEALCQQPGVKLAEPEHSGWEVFHQLLRGAELPTRLCSDAHLAALAIANGWRLQMCMTALSSTHRPWG